MIAKERKENTYDDSRMDGETLDVRTSTEVQLAGEEDGGELGLRVTDPAVRVVLAVHVGKGGERGGGEGPGGELVSVGGLVGEGKEEEGVGLTDEVVCEGGEVDDARGVAGELGARAVSWGELRGKGRKTNFAGAGEEREQRLDEDPVRQVVDLERLLDSVLPHPKKKSIGHPNDLPTSKKWAPQ